MTRLLALLVLLTGSAAATPVSAQSGPEIDCAADEQQVRIHYSLYFENFRAEAYREALPDLEWILACAPGFGGPEPDDRNYRRAVDVYEALAERTEDPAERERFLARAMELLDTAVSNLQDAGAQVDPYFWSIKTGRFLQTHPDDFPQRQGEVCALYEEAYTLRPDEIADFFLQTIAFCRTEAALAQDTPEMKRDTRTFLEGELMANADEQAARDYIQAQADRLITTPREQFEFMYARYQEVGAANLEGDELEQLFTFVSQAGAELLGSEEEARRVRRQLLTEVARLNPTFSRMSSLANAALADGDRDQAIAFYQQAMELAETSQQRRDVYYNIAVVRQQQGQIGTAANNLREALSIDGNHGPSLFLMGSMIQGSIRGSDLNSRAAYWCAADYFGRAASAGVSGASAAASRANSAAPSRDEYFFQGWRPGQTVTGNYGWGSCQARVR